MKALYRKYRPKNLSEVAGQGQVTDALKNAIKNSDFSHAYIFTGPRGTGKTSVARIFAHEINQFPYELEDSYVDIIEIDGASNRRIEDIREIREKATIAPTKGRYKIYIIDEFHMLTREAFNALLKTLEEPPEHVIFILATTDLEKVPITITSRAQLYNFSLATPEIMLEHLKKICEQEKIKISDGALKIIVERGGGSFRDSLSLLDQISTLATDDQEITSELIEKSLGLPQDVLVQELLETYASQDLEKISEKIQSVLLAGVKPETLASELVKKILKKPEPNLLPLLAKLPEVKAPFPEAKLLLAFIQGEKSQSFSVKAVPTAPILAKATVASQKVVQNSDNFSDTPVADNNMAENTNRFDWNNYLNSVKANSVGAAMWLKKCDFKIFGDTLELFPPTPTVRGILTSENNRQILAKCLNGFKLKIHDENSANSAEKDPKIAMINDIMGGTQEVKNGGEVPF